MEILEIYPINIVDVRHLDLLGEVMGPTWKPIHVSLQCPV